MRSKRAGIEWTNWTIGLSFAYQGVVTAYLGPLWIDVWRKG